jgi:hypothetical protein
MKLPIFGLLLLLLAAGCEETVPMDDSGIPRFTINAGDVALPMETVTDKQSGATELHFTLTKAKLDELRHFDHLVIHHFFESRSAHAKVWVGPIVINDSPDFRLTAQNWLSQNGKITLKFSSPDEAKSMATLLGAK